MAPLTLVGTLKAPSPGNARFPAIGANGSIVAEDSDGTNAAVFQVEAVSPYRVKNEEPPFPEFNKGGGVGRGLAWTVTFTESRALFHAPQTFGPFGGAKSKPGRITAGQFRYEWIDDLSVVTQDGLHTIGFGSAIARSALGNIWWMVTLDGLAFDGATQLLDAVASRLGAFWERRGLSWAPVAERLSDIRADGDWEVSIDKLLGGPVEIPPSG